MNLKKTLTEELKEIEKLTEEVSILLNKKDLPINNFYEEVKYVTLCLAGMRLEIDMCRGNFLKSDLSSVRTKRTEMKELLFKLKNKLLKFENKVSTLNDKIGEKGTC